MKFSHVLIGAVMLCSTTANAALVSVSPNLSSNGVPAEIIGAPGSVADDGATNSAMQGFNEVQDVVTTQDWAVDGGIIPMGSRVSSHMIFFNTEDTRRSWHEEVIWTFNNRILGVMSDSGGTLEAASNVDFAIGGTAYPGAFNARGFEDNFDNYAYFGKQIAVSMLVTEPGDWIRVITAVPVPAAVWLFGTALIGFIGFSRRRIVA